MNAEGFETAVAAFFRRPGLEFTRQMRAALDNDPLYLKSHEDVVTRGVEEVLTRGGIFWDEKIVRENAAAIVWEAVVRLRSVEKNRSTAR
ncbi:MAG: hypothetical protein FJ217_14095 [Ignavibacteria bacterium]|nr:hypothetical protein [Ignavibacteria bacterium]